MGDFWQLDLDGSYSEAERENTWAAVMTEVYPQYSTYDMRDGVQPSVTVSINTADPAIQFAPDWLGGAHDGPENLDDELYAVSADLGRSLDAGFLTGLKTGLRYSARDKSHRRNSWNQFPAAGGVDIPDDMLTSYQVDAFTAPWVLTGDFDSLAELVYGGFTDPGDSEVLEDRWQVEEDVIEAYLKFNFSTDALGVPLEGNLGARYVDVETDSGGFESVGGGPLDLYHGTA